MAGVGIVIALITAVATLFLAIGTFLLAAVTGWGVLENRRLIHSTQREVDLLWEAAIPYLIPERVEDLRGTTMADMTGKLTISYAAGTIPARAVKAWVGWQGRVWIGGVDLLTITGNHIKVLDLVQSRAGSEPPITWNDWLRRQQDGVTFRVVMRWLGPADNVTERAWWLSFGYWQEVPARLRG